MSGEGEQPQPKAAPAAPVMASAFINKGAKTAAPPPKKGGIKRRKPPPPAASKPSPAPAPASEEASQMQTQPEPTPAVTESTEQPEPTPAVEEQTAPQLPTSAATQEPISSFINKGANTFAPKKGKAVQRRRPKPPPPPASKANSAPTPTSEGASQTQPEPTPAVAESNAQSDPTPFVEQQTAAQLPTPAATQELIQQEAPQAEKTASELPTVSAKPNNTSPTVETPAPVNVDAVPRAEASTDASSAQATPKATTLPVAGFEDEPGRSPKQRRIESPVESEAHQVEPKPAVEDGPTHGASSEDAQSEEGQSPDNAPQQTNDDACGPTVQITPPVENAEPAETHSGASAIPTATPTEAEPAAHQNNTGAENVPTTQTTTRPARGKRTWNVVNTTDDNEEGSGSAPATAQASAPKPRKPPVRRRRKNITLQNLQEEEEEEARLAKEAGEGGDAEEDFVPPQPKRPRARGKRKAAEAVGGEGDVAVQPPPKKKRQPQKAKAKGSATATAEARPSTESGQEGVDGQVVEEGLSVEHQQSIEEGGNTEAVSQPKSARKKKRQTTSQPDGVTEGEQQPKRKGRAPRAPTPSDAEDEEINEDNYFMDDLARRTKRIGKVSQRERKMREINWEEVKERQKERELEQMNSKAVLEEIARKAKEREDRILAQQERVEYRVVDGVMERVEGTGQRDYEAIAVELQDEEVVEEDDFTNRVTHRSFMRNNKRYPEEFLLPGQGKRWDIRSTQDFYDALRMFGTDFGMMTTLFEGVSRRSLKLKFNREERKNPDTIKAILQSEDTRLKDWDAFLKASGKENEQFDKAEQIKRELAEQEEDHQRQVEEAKAEYEETQRQKKIAGALDDDAEAGKKKKGKKSKDKQVTFQAAEEFEVLEDDPNWGQD